METPPYGLIFEGLGEHRVNGWAGEWPPPEVFYVVQGGLTGRISFAEEHTYLAIKHEIDLAGTMTVRRFTRRSYSEIPPDLSSHVWPCAQYVEEGWTEEGGHLMKEETDGQPA